MAAPAVPATQQLQSLAATDFAAGQRCIELAAKDAAVLRALATDWFKAEQNIVARLALLQIEALSRQYILTHAQSKELGDQQLAKRERAFKKYGQPRSNCRSALVNIARRCVAEAHSVYVWLCAVREFYSHEAKHEWRTLLAARLLQLHRNEHELLDEVGLPARFRVWRDRAWCPSLLPCHC